MKSAILMVACGLWIAQTVFATGTCTADFEVKYPNVGTHRANVGECAAISIIPGSSIVVIPLSGFLEHGWHL
jgi:hypothetical protein